ANMGLTEPVIRQQAASAIQLVIQMARLRDGSRKVASVAEAVGATEEAVQIEEIFCYEQSGSAGKDSVSGKVVATGYRPQFLKRLQSVGVDIGNLFLAGSAAAQ